MDTKLFSGFEYFLVELYKWKWGRNSGSTDCEPLRFVLLQSASELKLDMESKFGPTLARNLYE